MKKELRFVKSGMKMYYKNTLYAGKVQTATARDLFDVASSGIFDKFVGSLVNKCRMNLKGRYDAEKNAVIISLEKDEQSALLPQKCTT